MVRDLDAFKDWLAERGALILPTAHSREIMRVRTHHGLLVVRRTKRGKQRWPPDLFLIGMQFLRGERPALAPDLHRKSRRIRAGELYAELVERDGDGCFYCGRRVPEPGEECPDGFGPSLEHLVATAHGGPNHPSNYALAHERCNNIAGDLPAVGKIKLREGMQGDGPAD